MKKEDWPKIIYGLRKKLDLSQTQLSKKINLCRQTLGRFEKNQRIPNKKSVNEILNFVKEKKLNISDLILLGENCLIKTQKREKSNPLKLPPSKELAELIGIILGDGEIKKDGSIRIAFDHKKDKNFLYRRVFPLVNNLLGTKIGFESYKRICFWNMSFVKYLKEYCNLKPGSKFENNWEIPKWCFEKKEYTSAVLRGLFDTDGYFGYCNGSVELMYGRFSDKSIKLVKSLEFALQSLNLKPITKQSNDGRFKIRICNKKEAIQFFKEIGSSNLRNICRFFLWRIIGYEAKIEVEGLPNLIKKCDKITNKKTTKTRLPFFWDNNILSNHKNFIPQDEKFIKTHIKKTKNL